MRRVAVIGGGPSGLLTTYLLEQKGREQLDVTLFEAERRLGGKVLTKEFATTPILYEAGVAELYRYKNDPLWRLVTRSLALPVVEMSGNMTVFEERLVRRDDDIRRHFGEDTARAVREFQRRARAARPFRSFYDAGCPDDNLHPWIDISLRGLLSEVGDAVARRFLQVLIHSDLATEPHLTHGLYGVDNYLINERDYCQLYSIEGGISRLIRELAARLTARVRLGSPVQAIETSADGRYQVVFEHDGQTHVDAFDGVVVALPLYALRHLRWSDGRLRSAVRGYVSCYEDAAHYLRVTALFRAPFWRAAFTDSWFIHDAFGGCCVYDEGARHDAGSHGVLSWLLAGSDALAMSRLGDDAIIAQAIASLPAAIADPAEARRQLIEGHVHRWIGMVYGMPAGRPIQGIKQRHYLDARKHRGLILAGDYLYDSTINGALDSAGTAAKALLSHLAV